MLMSASLNPALRKDQHPHIQHLNQLCYDNLMTVIRILLPLLALLLGFASVSAFSQSSGDGLAEELNGVRQQRRQLEHDIEQYETSIRLLRSSDSSQNTARPAVTALNAQLNRSRKRLLQLVDQEAVILDLLPNQRGAGRPPTNSGSEDLEAAEVARLKVLLRDYNASANYEPDGSAEPESSTTTTGLPTPAGNDEYAAGKVRLSGAEGVRAIQGISDRLRGDSSTGQRRQLDIVFHIEIRKNGALLSSRSHNLKALGESQYISKISLTGGTAVIKIRKDNWMVELASADTSDYLLTLSLAPGEAPELHVIPVDELKATQWAELPDWLPDIGVVATAPAS
jgi:hypothetical protein